MTSQWLGNPRYTQTGRAAQTSFCSRRAILQVHPRSLCSLWHEVVALWHEWLGKLGYGFFVEAELAGFAIDPLADEERDDPGIKDSMHVIDSLCDGNGFDNDKARQVRLTL
ncbi:hypothetical protein VC83_06443 [Pseudogymnoascus destructans]|uniref:Uncharacterized protein n=1 Tax=Pseudogymnoascus destructans TaxID=655981 RepID=A0A177A9Z4_9PEZI|nr:uncharacterized protein VC83_06443 [Pseudogymnoascus destructans]OAF58232.1 hypothetical protein VC83_06443 [Pseudogymnoascus destructans]